MGCEEGTWRGAGVRTDQGIRRGGLKVKRERRRIVYFVYLLAQKGNKKIKKLKKKLTATRKDIAPGPSQPTTFVHTSGLSFSLASEEGPRLRDS